MSHVRAIVGRCAQTAPISFDVCFDTDVSVLAVTPGHAGARFCSTGWLQRVDLGLATDTNLTELQRVFLAGFGLATCIIWD